MEENASKVYAGADAPPNPMTPGGSGSPLFVINLCASIAPVDVNSRNLPGLENYRLYQVARVEDGRTRHRLRLGFFTSESHAESVLTIVRQQYPTAFTTCLCDEDRRFVRGFLPQSAPAAKPSISPVPAPTPKASPPAASGSGAAKSSTPARTASHERAAAAAPARATAAPNRPAPDEVIEVTWAPEQKAQTPAAATAKPTVSAQQPAASPAAAKSGANAAATAKQSSAPSISKPQPTAAAAPAVKTTAPPPGRQTTADPAASMRVKALDLTLSDPPKPSQPQTRIRPNEPFHVGKGVEIGELPIELQSDAPRPAVAAATPERRAATQAAPASPHAARPTRMPDLDSTQTIRALTSAELNDDTQEKWFAIQLAASDQPVNLDTMPHLDIFEAYRLYSVATAGSGKIIHSLRLGFFREEVSAEAVAGYLKTFFSAPTVLRVSVAEHERFKDPPKPRKRPEESSAKVIELSDARAARPVPTVTMEVPTPADATGAFKPNATGSFKLSSSGKHKVLTPTLKPAAKTAGVATKRSGPLSRKTSATGKYKTLPRKSLSEQLLEEAREVELSESGIRKLPKNSSLLSKLVDKLTK